MGFIAPQVAEDSRRGKVLPAFALVGWRWVARNPAATIVPILLPFFFLYFLHLIAPPEYFPLEVAGAMLFTTQNIGSWCLSDSAHWRLQQRLQDLFVASPMGKGRYLLGVAFSNLIPAAPALVVQAIILSLVTPVTPLAWAVLLGCILVLWILFSSIGLALSSRLRSQREVWPVGNLVFTTLGILSPLYYPLSLLPRAWQLVASFLPATYAALLVQGALGLRRVDSVDMLTDASLLIVSTLAGVAIALKVYRWREN